MKEKLLNLFKNNKTLVLSSISLLLFLSFSIFFILYNSEANISKRTLKNIAIELNNINLSLGDDLKDFSTDTNKSHDILVSSSKSLNELLQSISKVKEINLEVISRKNDLTSAINSTMDLYTNCISILSDPKDIKSSDNLKTFLSLRENCINNYYNLNKNKMNIHLPETSLKFFDNMYNYLNTLIKINRDSEFQNKQQREFLIYIEGFNSDFYNLNQDLIPAINKAKEDNRDLQVIIDDIYNKEEIYENLKEKVLSLSVPDGCMAVYDSLNEYLNVCGFYLKTIKEAVIYEKTCLDINKYSKEIDKNYENAISKRDDVLKIYSSYKNKL